MATYLVFPDDAEQGVARHFSALRTAKIYAGTLAAKRNLNVRIWRENLKTGIMQRVDTVRPYYARKNPSRGMRIYYRLESSMGGYLGQANTLKQARKLAHNWSNSYGYAINVFKAKRDALKETRGDIVQVVSPSKRSGGRPASATAWIPASQNPGPSAPPTRGQTYTVATKNGPVRAKFVGETFVYYFFQPVSGGREIVMRKSTAGKRIENPAHGPSALPSKWTPATVTRKGRQIQIRVGGR